MSNNPAPDLFCKPSVPFRSIESVLAVVSMRFTSVRAEPFNGYQSESTPYTTVNERITVSSSQQLHRQAYRLSPCTNDREAQQTPTQHHPKSDAGRHTSACKPASSVFAQSMRTFRAPSSQHVGLDRVVTCVTRQHIFSVRMARFVLATCPLSSRPPTHLCTRTARSRARNPAKMPTNKAYRATSRIRPLDRPAHASKARHRAPPPDWPAPSAMTDARTNIPKCQLNYVISRTPLPKLRNCFNWTRKGSYVFCLEITMALNALSDDSHR
jgi:hypothetical protein